MALEVAQKLVWPSTLGYIACWSLSGFCAVRRLGQVEVIFSFSLDTDGLSLKTSCPLSGC